MNAQVIHFFVLCAMIFLSACSGHMTLSQKDNITASKTIFVNCPALKDGACKS